MHFHCCSRPSKYKPVTHIIFDLDGTILDSEEILNTALKLTLEDYGCEYIPELHNKVKGRAEADIAKIAIETYNLDITADDLLAKYDIHANGPLSDLDLLPGAERMILHLYNNNIPMAVATSSTQDSYELKTSKKYPELFSKFNHIVCGGSDPEVKNCKPDPDIYLVAASRFDDPPDPSKCLVFEDSEAGVRAALAAGMQVVMIPEDSVSYDAWKLATLRLDSFNYMMPELFGLPPFPEDDMAPEFAALIAPEQKSQPETPLAKGEGTPVVEQEEVPIFEDQISVPEIELETHDGETPVTENEETPITENEEPPELIENEETLENEEASEIENEEAPVTENEEAPVTENEEAPVTENEEPPATEE